MGETNSPSVAHVGYNISPLCVEKYRNPHGQLKENLYIHKKLKQHYLMSEAIHL
jgi:hypothetical protein